MLQEHASVKIVRRVMQFANSFLTSTRPKAAMAEVLSAGLASLQDETK
jgi:hypothetical protein